MATMEASFMGDGSSSSGDMVEPIVNAGPSDRVERIMSILGLSVEDQISIRFVEGIGGGFTALIKYPESFERSTDLVPPPISGSEENLELYFRLNSIPLPKIDKWKCRINNLKDVEKIEDVKSKNLFFHEYDIDGAIDSLNFIYRARKYVIETNPAVEDTLEKLEQDFEATMEFFCRAYENYYYPEEFIAPIQLTSVFLGHANFYNTEPLLTQYLRILENGALEQVSDEVFNMCKMEINGSENRPKWQEFQLRVLETYTPPMFVNHQKLVNLNDESDEINLGATVLVPMSGTVLNEMLYTKDARTRAKLLSSASNNQLEYMIRTIEWLARIPRDLHESVPMVCGLGGFLNLTTSSGSKINRLKDSLPGNEHNVKRNKFLSELFKKQEYGRGRGGVTWERERLYHMYLDKILNRAPTSTGHAGTCLGVVEMGKDLMIRLNKNWSDARIGIYGAGKIGKAYTQYLVSEAKDIKEIVIMDLVREEADKLAEILKVQVGENTNITVIDYETDKDEFAVGTDLIFSSITGKDTLKLDPDTLTYAVPDDWPAAMDLSPIFENNGAAASAAVEMGPQVINGKTYGWQTRLPDYVEGAQDKQPEHDLYFTRSRDENLALFGCHAEALCIGTEVYTRSLQDEADALINWIVNTYTVKGEISLTQIQLFSKLAEAHNLSAALPQLIGHLVYVTPEGGGFVEDDVEINTALNIPEKTRMVNSSPNVNLKHLVEA